jgi:hypothetical protein
MRIFDTLLSKIFNSNAAPAVGTDMSHSVKTDIQPQNDSIENGSAVRNIIPEMSQIDISTRLDALANENHEKLNWKNSIVDLLKLVGMDSSLAARKELAKELGFEGNSDDSASMNVWLHKQVLKKLVDNGGLIPKDLLK